MKDFNEYINITKTRLRRLAEFRALLQSLEAQKQEIELELDGESVAISRYGTDTGGGFSELNAVEKSAQRRMEKESELEGICEDIRKVKSLLHRMDIALDGIGEDDRELITMHYMKHYSWGEVARRFNYSEQWARKRAGRVIRTMAEITFGKKAAPPKQTILTLV